MPQIFKVGGCVRDKLLGVESNDMWAIGNYGRPNDIYIRLLRDRYFEIIATK